MSKQILVGGGNGFIGTQLCKYLNSSGHKVLVISRKPTNGQCSWLSIEKSGLPNPCNVIINLAGHNILDPFHRWNDTFRKEIYNSRVNTNIMLSKYISAAKIKPDLFISMSGVAIYPHSDEVLYTESWQPDLHNSTDFLQKLVYDLEKAAMVNAELYGVRSICIRSGVVLGRNGGMIQQLIWPFFFGLGGKMGTGKQWMPWIHVKDLARLIIHCIDCNDVEGIVNATAPEHVTNKDFVKAFATELHRPAMLNVPEFIFDKIYGEQRSLIITKGQRVLSGKIVKHGFKFIYPTVRDACQECAHIIYEDNDNY